MPGSEVIAPRRPSLVSVIGRGFRRRCPSCGRGALFRAYLKPADACAACGEALGHIRADDAPPYFTIVVVGHIVVSLILAVELSIRPPMWLHMTIWPALTLALTLLLLPPIKGALVGVMWRLQLKGNEFQ